VQKTYNTVPHIYLYTYGSEHLVRVMIHCR